MEDESIYPFTGLSKYSKELNYKFDDLLFPRFRCLHVAYRQMVDHLDHLARFNSDHSSHNLVIIEQQLEWSRAASNVHNRMQRGHVRSDILEQLMSLDTCSWMLNDGKVSLSRLRFWRQFLNQALFYVEYLLDEAPRSLSTIAKRQVPEQTRENLEDLVDLVQSHLKGWQAEVDSWRYFLTRSNELDQLLMSLLGKCLLPTPSHTDSETNH